MRFLKNNIRITINDVLLLLFMAVVLIFYDYDSNIAPTYLLVVIQLVLLWIILRMCFSIFPVILKYIPYFILLVGLIQAFWGLGQLYNFLPSNHVMFKTTGSFFNSGPYGGFIALMLPIALYYWVNFKRKNKIVSYVFLFVGAVFILVFPATLSRTAWIAASVGCLLVLAFETNIVVRIRIFRKRHKRQFRLYFLIMSIMLIVILSGVYYLKKDSANGRLFMWKVTTMAIKDASISGVGLGGFPASYADAQMTYFESGKASEIEKLVAGSPEYAFNEYLRIFLEQGVVGGIIFVVLTISIIASGVKNKHTGVVASFLVLSIFAFASYPFYLWEFLVMWIILGAISVSKIDKKSYSKGSYIAATFLMVIILSTSFYFAKYQYSYHQSNQEWKRLRPLYSMKTYDKLEKEYDLLYPKLNYNPKFVFEFGIILNSIEKREKADSMFDRGLAISCDPMFYNVKGRNYHEMGEYDKAEAAYINSTHLLPERIYPYYLLTKLYADSANYKPDKMHWAANCVIENEPKVHSMAINEMRAEVRKILKDKEGVSDIK